MSTIVIDEALREKLRATGSAELRDESGNFVGRFVAADEVPEFSAISYAEMERRLASGQRTYTTAEVMEHLRKLA